MFPTLPLFLSSFANMVITFSLCVNFTGEEVPIHLSMFFPSRRAQCGSVLCVLLNQHWSPAAPPAMHLQPRSSQWDQEQPCWAGAQVHTVKTLPPSCYGVGKQKTGFIYNLPQVETKRSDPLLLKISQATQEEKWYLVVIKGSELHNNFMLC